MNDALRLLRKMLRRYGYDVKRRYEYNLLSIKNQDVFNQLTQLSESQDRNVGQTEKNNFTNLYVCLRICLRQDNKKKKTQNITGASHEELVFRCLHSVVESINHAKEIDIAAKIYLVVFDDHSDDEYRTRIINICNIAQCEQEIITTQNKGQGASLLEQFQFARAKDGLFYFCEDDYLHEKEAIYEMYQFYNQIYRTCGTHLVIHPQEHEFLYIKSVYPSYLLLGESRHWRTISHATHVLFTHSSIVSDYWEYFEKTKFVGNKKKRRLGSEAQNTNLLFNHIPGFAPIPALAAHMYPQNCIPPFFNWKDLWDKNKLD